MNRRRLAIFAIFFAFASGLKAQDKIPFKQVATILLPGLKDGDFDHFTPDVEGHRMFLTAEENGKVIIFDTNSNKVIHTIEDLKSPHSILYRKDLKKLFIVDGDDSAVKIFDSDTYKMTAAIKTAIDSDSLAYDPVTKYLYVVAGGREAHTPYSLISVIDTSTAKKLRDIKIENNHVEALVLEKSGKRLFCNITGANAVGVMDRDASGLSATWPLPAGDKSNVAMAFDEVNHRLFVATRDPGKLVVLNSDNFKVIADLPAVGMVDDAAYDAKNKRVYLAGDQFVDIFQQTDPDHYQLLAKVPGSFRAKTGILVPELNRYYLAVPHHENKTAEIRVYEIQP